MRRILRYLLNPYFAATAVFGLVAASLALVLWLRRAEISQAALLLSIVVLLWFITLLVLKIRAMRAGTAIEKVIRHQADEAVLRAGHEHRGEVQLLRSRLLAAIETLRKSHIGRVRGRAALYELPWYLIIGHPAAGKSSAITQSGLSFPFSDQGQPGVQGVGGTRNCDWFFTSEGVLLDTAGRYATEADDRQEWLSFLKLLKRYRRRTPVNGVLVAASLCELGRQSEEELQQYVRQVRERLHEINAGFGVRVPVYFAFTKVDLLPGFAEFFADASEAERNTTWGFTLDIGDRHESASDLISRICTEFDGLVAGLQQRACERLGATRANANRPELFVFPGEFAVLRSRVLRFVELLLTDNPYHAQPIVRGLYFSSALQSAPAGALPSPLPANVRRGAIHRLAERFRLQLAQSDSAAISRSYFLRDFFRDVLFADQHLLMWLDRRRTRIRKWVLSGVAASVAAVLIGVLTISFLGNHAQVQTLQDTLARQDLAAAELIDARVDRLVFLATQLASLDQQQREGVPWRMSWGLYQGPAMREALETRLLAEGHELVLLAARNELARRLSGLASSTGSADAAAASTLPGYGELRDWQGAYDALRLYLQLRDVHRHDEQTPAALAQVWQQIVGPRLHQRGVDAGTASQLVQRFHVLTTQAGWPELALDDALVARVRQQLIGELKLQVADAGRVYAATKLAAADKFAPLGLVDLLQGKDVEWFEDVAPVAGIYADRAWSEHFRASLIAAAKGIGGGVDWVLDVDRNPGRMAGSDAARFELELLDLYQREREAAWRDFVLRLRLKPATSLEQMGKGLGRFADAESSPLKRLLLRVVNESGVVERLRLQEKLAAQKQLPAALAVTQTDPLLQHLHVLLQSGTGKAQVEDYLQLLGKIRERSQAVSTASQPGTAARQLVVATFNGSSEFSQLQQWVDGSLVNVRDEAARDALRNLLLRPAGWGFSALVAPVGQEINQAWRHEVWSHWNEISGRYPFAEAGNEVSLDDVAQLLRPGEGALTRFHTGWVAELVSRRGNNWSVRSWNGIGVRIDREYFAALDLLDRHGRSTFGSGNDAALRLEFQPVPTPGLSEILLEVDGQALRYRNGPQPWKRFQWPGEVPAPGAGLKAIAFSGAPLTVANHDGRMGLLRLLLNARSQQLADGTLSLSWPVAGATDGKTVQFNMRVISGGNPLGFVELRHLSLPGRVVL